MDLRGNATAYCGRCNHPMHWKDCGAPAMSVNAPWCPCRNDESTIEAIPDLGDSQVPSRPDYGYTPRYASEWGRPGRRYLIAALVIAFIAAGFWVGRVSATPRAAPPSASSSDVPSVSAQPGVPQAVPVARDPVPLHRGEAVKGRSGAPAPTSGIGSPLQGVQGLATWYCCTARHRSGLYAAAGPALRVGHWRGRVVTVCSPGACVRVRLIDACRCGHGRVVDLSRQAFRRLAPLSQGVVGVTVSWGDEPPATDTGP